MDHSYGIQFISRSFDFQSTLPEGYNAGNRCYGRDVAEFIASSLTDQGMKSDFLGEDWGWLVFSQKGTKPEFDVAVYNMADVDGSATSKWGLWVHTYERSKLLRLIPKRTEVATPSSIIAALKSAVMSAGAEPLPWPDAPH